MKTSMNIYEDAAYSLEGVLSEKHGLDKIQVRTIERASKALLHLKLVMAYKK